MIRERLQDRARNFNIVLDDVSLTHVAFSPEFTRAVEAKQVAQQTALRAAFLVDQAVQEKEVCGPVGFAINLMRSMRITGHHCPCSG
jgi:regulator of protease activity HflC (stomatin/prohibitin superfamily)